MVRSKGSHPDRRKQKLKPKDSLVFVFSTLGRCRLCCTLQGLYLTARQDLTLEHIHVGVEVVKRWWTLVEDVGLANGLEKALAKHNQSVINIYVQLHLNCHLLSQQLRILGLQ